MAYASLLRDLTMRMPPREMSRNRRWKPRASPDRKRNMPYSGMGYSDRGRKLGSRRNDRPTFVGVKKLES